MCADDTAAPAYDRRPPADAQGLPSAPNLPRTSMHIRTATPADADTIAPLFDAYRQFYGQAPDLARARQFITGRLASEESVVLLAVDNAGKAAGFCQLYPTLDRKSVV